MSAVEQLDTPDLEGQMTALGCAARGAAHVLGLVDRTAKDAALTKAATAIRDRETELMAANAADMAGGRDKGLTAALLDRLELTHDRVESIAAGLEAIAAFKDPVGDIVAAWKQPSGLNIERVRVPLGVIGVIYESRPNVTADAGGLCLKAGNAAVLRGGSESFNSSRAIVACLHDGLAAAGLPEAAIQLLPTTDRAAVGLMLRMSEYIDVIVPRGGKSLIARVQDEARMPVFAHLEGLCHTYVHAAAEPAMARAIVLNAKMRRTSICGATETVLLDRAAAAMLSGIVDDLVAADCEVRGDAAARALDARITPAGDDDWTTEYLDAIVSVKLVDGVNAAVDWVNRHGSSHTDAIVTGDAGAAEIFLREVDSAIVLHNASTQYADGGEFGMGAEIGISTGKMHARGPVGVEELTSYKYIVRGSGQIRP